MKKIMKNLKKIPTLLMLVLSIFMTVPSVFAETTANANTVKNTDEAGAITISGIEPDKLNDVTISAYQLMTTNIKATYETNEEGEIVLDEDDNPVIASWQPKQPVFTWNSSVATWLRSYANGKYSSYVGENDEVTPAFTQCKGENTSNCLNADAAKAFYDELAAVIKTLSPAVPVKTYAKTASGEKIAWTESNGTTTISGLEMGNYLVLIENGVNIYSPSAINVIPTKAEGSNTWTAGDTQLKVKYTTPSIDKEITSATPQGGIGSTVSYRITVGVPQYPVKATAKKVEIKDTLTGLTLNANTIKVKVDGNEITSGFTKTNTATGFTITFADEDYDDVLRGHTTIVVEYDATIASTAEVTSGNDNDATLSYNNNPYDDESFEPLSEDTETVYTYGVKVTKVKEGEEETKLPGAKFSVYTQETGGEAIGFVLVEEGIYRKALDNEPEGVTVVYELEVGSTGNKLGVLEVRGLAEGTYWFEETEAPEGYVKLQKRKDVTLTDKETTTDEDNNSIDVWDGVLENDDDGFADLEIPNNDDIPVLPVTGGIGTILFSVLGILFMGLGAFLIKNIFKKEDVK